MTPKSRPLIQEWNKYTGTYDFISALVRRSGDGCKVSFTRYVIKADYIPRIERLNLTFPYHKQPLYCFFDENVWVTGFYRHSARDIDLKELLPGPDDLPLPHLTNR